MSNYKEKHQTNEIRNWIALFLIDREAGNKSPGTITFYAEKLNKFASYCNAENIADMYDITADVLRHFLLWLRSIGHNEGGVLANYRAVKAFFRWWIDEVEPEGFRDPFLKVKTPKVSEDPLPPVSLDVVNQMVKSCGNHWHGIRDTAILLCLLDTGARAAEFTALNVEDIDMRSGSVEINRGKGGKSRTVFIEKTAQRALKNYLRNRQEGPLWVKNDGERLTYDGLRSMVRNRAIEAKVVPPTPHDFRRAFAINMIRAGCDLETLRRLMGHANLHTLHRYLRFVNDDLRRVHSQTSPANQLNKILKRSTNHDKTSKPCKKP